jgi:phage N-6-adenine-methyltransferase
MGKGIGGHTSPGKGATDSWITPKHIIDQLGYFDLDPCASNPQPWPCAKQSIALPDDGLAAKWEGSVWLNPPYSQVWTWMHKLAYEHKRGIALIFARTETKGFFENVWRKADAVLFLKGRLWFYKPDGTRGHSNAGGPSVLVAYGETAARQLVGSKLDGKYIKLK